MKDLIINLRMKASLHLRNGRFLIGIVIAKLCLYDWNLKVGSVP